MNARYYSIDPRTLEARLVASFVFVGAQVQVTYARADGPRDFETLGGYTQAEGTGYWAALVSLRRTFGRVELAR